MMGNVYVWQQGKLNTHRSSCASELPTITTRAHYSY